MIEREYECVNCGTIVTLLRPMCVNYKEERRILASGYVQRRIRLTINKMS